MMSDDNSERFSKKNEPQGESPIESIAAPSGRNYPPKEWHDRLPDLLLAGLRRNVLREQREESKSRRGK